MAIQPLRQLHLRLRLTTMGIVGIIAVTATTSGLESASTLQNRRGSVGPPAMPAGSDVMLMERIGVDERVLRERLAVLVKDRKKALQPTEKAANKLYAELPKAPRGQWAIAHLDPGRAPIEAVRTDIDGWKGLLNREYEWLIDLEDPRLTIADIVVLFVQKAVRNAEQLIVASERLDASAASLHSGEQLGLPKEDVNLRRVRAKALAGQLEAHRQLQTTAQAILMALEQGGPAQYQARYDAWMAASQTAARKREREWQAMEERFGDIMAGFFVGAYQTIDRAEVADREKRNATKLADPNYDRIMAQTRKAYREACEADGGMFEDGKGDDPGTCKPKR
jgi:hypothetical protein